MSDFKIEKPGKYVRRDGLIETVHAILPPECGMTYAAVGSFARTWALDGSYTNNSKNPHAFDLIAPWTEPRFRAWRAEDFAFPLLVRWKTDPDIIYIPVARYGSGVVIVGNSGRVKATWPELLEHCEHSLDHGKTWKPCGVEEAQ